MKTFTLAMASNGRLVIPASMRAELKLRPGAKLIAHMADGALILEPVEAAIRRAQAMVRRHVPEGTPLVDELIAERREAAARE